MSNKGRKWYNWMNAYKVERNRRNSIVALSQINPEFKELGNVTAMDEHRLEGSDAGRGRLMSDWAHKETREGFLEEVVEDAMKIDRSRATAKKIVDEMVTSMAALAAQSKADHRSADQLRLVGKIQSGISTILAGVIVYMHSTGTDAVVVSQSFISTVVVMIAACAFLAAAKNYHVGKNFNPHNEDRFERKLNALLEVGKSAVKLLAQTGGEVAENFASSEANFSLDTYTLPRDQFDEPSAADFKVRSANYLSDQSKVKSKPAVFQLIAVDLVETKCNMQNIAAHPNNRVAKAFAHGDKDTYTLVFNFMIPGPPFLSFSAYWKVDKQLVNADTPFGRVAKPFFFGDSDKYCNDRFKFIPKVVEGNFAIKVAVKDTPTLMGHKLKQYYHRADHYFEIDVDISSSSVARNITGLVLGYAKTLEIQMALVLQGEGEDELPEIVMGTCSAKHVDLLHAVELE